MSVLLIRLAGPMQAWGTQSRFSIRDTGLEPSKSGVIGLLCAALGKPRNEGLAHGDWPALAELGQLTMAVRVDRPGVMARDFHTALDVIKASGKRPSREKDPKFTSTSMRYYLADADFLVGLQGPTGLLERLHQALGDPVWPLYLGRKSFVPSLPVRISDGLLDAPLPEALKAQPWYKRTPYEHPGDALRIVMEVPYGADGEVRNDRPLNFVSADRLFGVRRVRDIEPWPVPDELIKEWPPCTCRN